MSVIEGKYQLKPQGRGGLWWSIVGVAVVLLLLPTLINLVVPDKANDYKQLEIDLLGVDWSVPITTEESAAVLCEETSDEITQKYWDCNGNTTVVTMIVEGVKDPSNTLRRMVGSSLITSVDDSLEAVSSEDGRAHALYVPGQQEGSSWTLPIVALSVQGSGDYEDLTAIAIINGTSLDYYSTHIWSSMAADRGLPYQQDFPLILEEEPWQDTPGGDLPFELPNDFFDQYPDLFGPGSVIPNLEGESL
ncbi:hypothetical protein BSP99_00975 [Corynebacterium glutamicum]|uniref:hypothetical protein n=1 Tax=Corynebacterium glutamicum TaxID=1718 RepID=UPI00094A5E22|nr:hypothetical protein [Corynebacterium glutamicum]APT06188.1 hypothetical protein BSP99_00975 [Corynebacterium glutamicum]